MKFLPLFAANIFWFSISFPARLSPDSIEILSNVKNSTWSSVHMIAYEYFVSATSLGGKFPWLTVIVQLTILSSSIYFLFQTISAKFKKINEALLTSIILVTPYGGGIATVIWADSLNCSMLVLFIAMAFRFQSFKKKREYFVFFLVSLLGTQFRKESFLVEIFVILILIISFRIPKFVQVKILTISFLAISIGAGVTAYTVEEVDKIQSPIWTNYQVMVGDLVNYSRLTDEVDLDNFVGNFASRETVEASSECQNIFSVVFSPGFQDNGLKKVESKIVITWIRESIRHLPSFILIHNCRAGNFLPPPLGFSPKYVYWIPPGQIPNELGYSGQSTLTMPIQVSNLVWTLLQAFGLFIGWPGFIIFVALIFGFRIHKIPEIRTLLTISVLHGFLMYIFAPAPDFRLGMIPSILSLIVILIATTESKVKFRKALIFKKR